MTLEKLAFLVERAQQNDQAAFHDVVTHTINDVRLFIASYVPTTTLGDAILHEAYAVIQREFAHCPKHEVSAWMCRVAATQLTARIGDATTTKDPLIQLMVQNGREALAHNLTGINAAAVELPRRLQMQPPSLRQLLQRHYDEGFTVATIAEKQGLIEDDVAQALMTARARMDWTGVAEVSDTADKTFPRVVEDFLSGTLVPDTRALLLAGVMDDPARTTQFQRQVRLHLLLQTLLTPFAPAQVKELILGLPRNEESSRLAVTARTENTAVRTTNRRNSSSALRSRDSTRRTTRQSQESSAIRRGYVLSSSTTTDDHDLGEDAPPPVSRLPLYLGLGTAALGLLALFIMKSQSSMPTPTVSARSAQSVAVAADSSTEGRGPSATIGREKTPSLAGASGSSVTKNSSVPVTNAAPEHPVAPAPLAPPAPPTFVPTAPIPTVPLGPPGYFWCAVEGCRFELSGINDVAYGIDGRFLFLYKQTGTILFSPITFGGDPASGYHKAGFYKPVLGK